MDLFTNKQTNKHAHSFIYLQLMKDIFLLQEGITSSTTEQRMRTFTNRQKQRRKYKKSKQTNGNGNGIYDDDEEEARRTK